MRVEQVQADGLCPFRRKAGRPHLALAHCPEVGDPCPCVKEILRHGLGEVDRQTVRVVTFWQRWDPMPCTEHREMLPEWEDDSP